MKPYPLPINKITNDDPPKLVDISTERVEPSTTQTSTTIDDELATTTAVSRLDVLAIRPTSHIGAVLLDLLQNDKTFDIHNATLHEVLEKLDRFNATSAKHSSYNIEAIDDSQYELLETITSSSLMPPPKEVVDTSVATWTQPSLFPVHTKQTGDDDGESHGVQKVFNETLHAWISESPTKGRPQHNHRPDIVFDAAKLDQSTNIKNISSIFDTLSSKLDTMPNSSMNFKARNPLPILLSTTSTAATTVRKEYTRQPVRSTTAASVVFGEAEIEEVDPTQYEAMLMSERIAASQVSSSLTTQVPSLVTLMPVKSNSGIRPIFKNGILMEAHYSRRPIKRVR